MQCLSIAQSEFTYPLKDHPEYRYKVKKKVNITINFRHVSDTCFMWHGSPHELQEFGVIPQKMICGTEKYGYFLQPFFTSLTPISVTGITVYLANGDSIQSSDCVMSFDQSNITHDNYLHMGSAPISELDFKKLCEFDIVAIKYGSSIRHTSYKEEQSHTRLEAMCIWNRVSNRPSLTD